MVFEIILWAKLSLTGVQPMTTLNIIHILWAKVKFFVMTLDLTLINIECETSYLDDLIFNPLLKNYIVYCGSLV